VRAVRQTGVRTLETHDPIIPELLLSPTERDAVTFAFAVAPGKEAALVGCAMAVAAAGHLLGDRYIARRCPPCNPEDVNGIDRGAVRWHSRMLESLSYVMELAAVASPFLITLRERGLRRETAEDLVVQIEALALTTALNITVKTLIQRPIPMVYAGRGHGLETKASGYRSFYSGHVAHMASALCANAVVSHFRGRGSLRPWGLAAVGTAAVAFARVGAGRHFYSDVTAGALAGAAVGTLVPLLHPKRTSKRPNVRGKRTSR